MGALGLGLEYTGTGDYRISFNKEEISSAIAFFFVNDFFSTLLPVALNTYSYYQVYKILNSTKMLQYYNTKQASRFFVSLSVPIICFLPGILLDMIGLIWNYDNDYLEFISQALTSIWLVLVLWSFCILNPSDNSRRRETSISIDLSEISSSKRTTLV